MKTQEFDYSLPQELIAQTPIANRDQSRLLVVDRTSGTLAHQSFTDVVSYISQGDVLVINDTRVIPARLFGRRKTGGRIEILLLHQREKDLWECLVKPGSKARPEEQIFIGNGACEAIGTVKEKTSFGGRLIEFQYDGKWDEILSRLGNVPLPPYIKAPLKNPERYQTVYARVPGSAAAPTAGLHFTPDLLTSLSSKGVLIVPVTLNVGLGTFRPVAKETVEQHKMHEESFEISENTARAINMARASGRKLFAVGTTVVRALEASSEEDGSVVPFKGTTDIFIYPGYRFKTIDSLITNFHLPKSTLLMLVSGFAGKDLIMEAYMQAVEARYRFFSFGDAMLIL